MNRILVVDDDAGACELLQTALSARGFDVTACASANDAIARMHVVDYDLVLTDLDMPEMDGLELIARATNLRPRTPCIVMTARSDVQTVVRAMRGGAIDFIAKPLSLAVLAESVDQALNRDRAMARSLHRDELLVHARSSSS